MASGSPLCGVPPVVQALQLHQRGGYILRFNGGHLVNYHTGEVLDEYIVAPEESRLLSEGVKDVLRRNHDLYVAMRY